MLYDRWTEEYDLARPAVEDGIMKGFDVAQGIHATGEAAVHEDVLTLLARSSAPYPRSGRCWSVDRQERRDVWPTRSDRPGHGDGRPEGRPFSSCWGGASYR